MDIDTHKEEEHGAHTHSHGYGIFILVFFGLLALTGITVSVAGINLGSLTLTVALVIATIKTCLVVNYFMHVKFDTPIFKVFIAVCIVIFATMIGLTFFDLIFRTP